MEMEVTLIYFYSLLHGHDHQQFRAYVMLDSECPPNFDRFFLGVNIRRIRDLLPQISNTTLYLWNSAFPGYENCNLGVLV